MLRKCAYESVQPRISSANMILLVIASLFFVQVLGDAIPGEGSELVGQHDRVKRLVGGKPSQIGHWPWLVSIQKDGSHVCGGTILNSRVILTAAHCFQFLGSSRKRFSIRAGSSSYDYEGREHKIAEVRAHPDFQAENTHEHRYNDLGLIKVYPPFEFNQNVRPIQLASKEYFTTVGTSASIAGWGKRKFRGVMPAVLREAIVYIRDKAECIKNYNLGSSMDWSGLFCAASATADRCNGDDGGPLMINSAQVGIVAWGKNCGESAYPGVYTNVSLYRDWIDENSRQMDEAEYNKEPSFHGGFTR